MFESKSDMLVHSQRVHKQDPKPYKCPTCAKSFANSSYLSQHNRIHAGIKPYRCEVCERKFTQLSHLQQHMRTHTGEKPYKCQYQGCGKAFTQLANLQQHSRSHMTDKPFRCNSCYKCYSTEDELRDHIPKHSDTKHLKTHICNVCGKSYTQETYLARHMTKHALNNNNTHNKIHPLANMNGNKPSIYEVFDHDIRQNGEHKFNMLKETQSQIEMIKNQIKQEDCNSGCMFPGGEDLRKTKLMLSNNNIHHSDPLAYYVGQKSPSEKSSPSGGSTPVTTKPSAFSSFPQPNGNMVANPLASNFPFPQMASLPNNTLGHPPSPHISQITSPRYFPYEPVNYRKMVDANLNMEKNYNLQSTREGSIANNLLSLQHIKNYSTHQIGGYQNMPHTTIN